uniref:Uncharacterized protein n=1 Tax=Anopheles farauti TaxID=69004 RepID=A0A182QL18_9DIPT
MHNASHTRPSLVSLSLLIIPPAGRMMVKCIIKLAAGKRFLRSVNGKVFGSYITPKPNADCLPWLPNANFIIITTIFIIGSFRYVHNLGGSEGDRIESFFPSIRSRLCDL